VSFSVKVASLSSSKRDSNRVIGGVSNQHFNVDGEHRHSEYWQNLIEKLGGRQNRNVDYI